LFERIIKSRLCREICQKVVKKGEGMPIPTLARFSRCHQLPTLFSERHKSGARGYQLYFLARSKVTPLFQWIFANLSYQLYYLSTTTVSAK
jgi:hypothetical protein